jgi:hypothetical protein
MLPAQPLHEQQPLVEVAQARAEDRLDKVHVLFDRLVPSSRGLLEVARLEGVLILVLTWLAAAAVAVTVAVAVELLRRSQ